MSQKLMTVITCDGCLTTRESLPTREAIAARRETLLAEGWTSKDIPARTKSGRPTTDDRCPRCSKP